jgi:hypothetical protein
MFRKEVPFFNVKRRFSCWKHGGDSIEARETKLSFMSALSIGQLVDVKKVALRRGVWFRVLDRVERSVLDLTVRCVDKIKSTILAKVVTAILNKLKLAMESTVERIVRVIGCSLSQKVSSIALSWGNLSASQWVKDTVFARYLAITQMNTPTLYRV